MSGKKERAKKQKTPQNNDVSDVLHTQGRDTAIEQNQGNAKGLTSSITNNTSENTFEKRRKRLQLLGTQC